jgi:DNA gyrase subunit B
LLTFFYRQMRELIDRGHIYIAQPPLYKVKRGSSEQYLKDERAIEDYLTQGGTDVARYVTQAGAVHTGADLLDIAHQARDIVHQLDTFNTRYSRSILEQAAIVGALDPEALLDPARIGEIAQRLANRMDRVSDEVERGWTAEPDGTGGLVLSRTVRGVAERHELDAGLLASADARKMRQMMEKTGDLYRGVASLIRKDATTSIYGPTSLFAAVSAAGRKGISLQRYKGLGEMNPEQLWETTLDPNVRTLLKVEIKDSDDHDRLFSELMGDLVEPRREFIQTNALNVANLDI